MSLPSESKLVPAREEELDLKKRVVPVSPLDVLADEYEVAELLPSPFVLNPVKELLLVKMLFRVAVVRASADMVHEII